MKTNKKILFSILMAFNTFCSLISFFNMNSLFLLNNLSGINGINSNSEIFNLHSDNYQITEQWLKNPTFDSPISPNWTPTTSGELTDFELLGGSGLANYTVIGEQGTEIFERNFSESGWIKMHNPDFPSYPSEVKATSFEGIDSDGILANHSWDETVGDQVGQDPSVLWKRNESFTKDMSDYEISSASITAVFNVSADSNIDRENDPEGNSGYTWDHVLFFIKLSDINASRNYLVAYYQFENDTTLNDTYMKTFHEENLIFYLSSIFEQGTDFTITVGINFFCEDNMDPQDTDTWYYARIKSLNLTFSYKKIINQDTRGYWIQTSDKLNVTGKNFEIDEAKLYFQYRVDPSWPIESPNSEFIIKVNNNTYSETIKLSNLPNTLEEARINGFDVKHLLVKYDNVSVSLEVSLADTFNLSTNKTISIDNVRLNITLTVLEEKSKRKPPSLILPTSGEDWTWLIILLSILLTAIMLAQGIYTFRVKRPPMIRKIRKLKKRIKKNNLKNPVQVQKRSTIIQRVLSYKLKSSHFAYASKPLKPKVEKKLKQKRPKKEGNLKLLLFFALFAFLLFIISSSAITNGSLDPNILPAIRNFILPKNSNFDLQSKDTHETKQWIKNPLFNSPINQYWSTSKGGDLTDMELTEDTGYVNYVVMGDNRTENYINNPPEINNWTMVHDPDHPTFPNETLSGTENAWSGIVGDGAFSNHSWREGGPNQLGQDPSVLWKRNITLPVNFTDYEITSASLSTNINASPLSNVENAGDGSYQGRGDYVRFFIRVSDLSGNITYEIANYLHEGDSDLSDTPMNNVTDTDLMFFLSSVLQEDGYNFTLTMGINFWCEDNEGTDNDEWEYTYIKEFNLHFTYHKKINQFTYARWDQVGDRLNGRDFRINEAKLYFQYKTDTNWTHYSNNSEFRIVINSSTHSETIKLTLANSTFQDAKFIGFDVTNLMIKNDNIRVSLEVYIADNFPLEENLTISIDNVSLYISRTIIIPPDLSSLLLLWPVTNPNWMIFFLIIMIIVFSILFSAYQTYYRYPPTVRTLRKLRKDIKGNKFDKPASVKTRENLIQNHLDKKLKGFALKKAPEIDTSKLITNAMINQIASDILSQVPHEKLANIDASKLSSEEMKPITTNSLTNALKSMLPKSKMLEIDPSTLLTLAVLNGIANAIKSQLRKKEPEVEKPEITDEMINKIAADLIAQVSQEKLVDLDASKLSSGEMNNIITNSLKSLLPKRKRLEITTAQLLTVDVLNKIASATQSQLKEKPEEELEPLTDQMINKIAADLIAQVPQEKLLDLDASKLSSGEMNNIITNSLKSLYPKRKRLEINTAQLLTVDVLNKIASATQSQLKEKPEEELEPLTEEMINKIAADVISQVPREKLLDIDALKLSSEDMDYIITNSLKSLYPQRKLLDIDIAKLLSVDVLNKIASAIKSQLKEIPEEEVELITDEMIDEIAADLMNKFPQQKLSRLEPSDLKTKKINKIIVKNLKSMLPKEKFAKISDAMNDDFYDNLINSIKSQLPRDRLLDSFIAEMITEENVNRVANDLLSQVPKEKLNDQNKEALLSEVTEEKIESIIESILPREKILELDTSKIMSDEFIHKIANTIKTQLPKEKLLIFDTSEMLTEEVFNKIIDRIKAQLPKEKLLELDTSELLTDEMKNVISNAIKAQLPKEKLLQIDPTELLTDEMINGIATAVITQLPIEKLLELDTSELLTQETINNINNAVKDELIKVKPPLPELTSYILTKVNIRLKKKKRPLVDILRFVEPNLQFNEKLITFYLKFRAFVPEIHIKEIIPENLKIKKQIPFLVPREVQKTEDGKTIQIWKIVPELARDTFEFGYICSGEGIENEFPFEMEIHGMEISSAKEKQKELKKTEVFTPNFHELIQKYKETEYKEI